MAVLVEAISVVIRMEALLKAYGTWEAFKHGAPNGTLCADNELVRVGFMAPDDAKSFVARLADKGLEYLDRVGRARDLIVVDQQSGPMAPCDWIEFGRIDHNGDPARKVAACRLKGDSAQVLYTPEGWAYEDSLSAAFGFVKAGLEDKSLTFLGHENGTDVYLNRLTGKRVFVGRPKL